jgi:hypothetical protein
VRTWPLREGRPRARGVEAQAATVAALDALVNISGDRYGAEQMKHLDSERHTLR